MQLPQAVDSRCWQNKYFKLKNLFSHAQQISNYQDKLEEMLYVLVIFVLKFVISLVAIVTACPRCKKNLTTLLIIVFSVSNHTACL
jgi:hypothetical protein